MPSSTAPAFSHLSIILRMTPSVTRWSRNVRRWECGIESKYLRTFIGTMKVLRLPARAYLLPYCFGHRSHAHLLCSWSQSAPGEFGGNSSGPEPLVSRRSFPGILHTWARAGSHRFPGDPSYAFALLQDPGRADRISP